MKNLIKHLIVIGIVVFAGSALNAQTTYVRHVKLTEYHTKAKTYASNNTNKSLSNQNDYILNTEEAGRSLQIAMQKHSELKKTMLMRYGSALQSNHDIIDSHHKSAVIHYQAMKAEAAKRNYDRKKISDHAKNMYLSIEKAELEHQMLKYKTS